MVIEEKENGKNNLNEPVPQFATVAQIAKLLKVSKMTIFRYIKDEKNPLPAIFLSDTTIRIPWDQFNMWLNSMSKGGEFK